jgi:hypothetical protein
LRLYLTDDSGSTGLCRHGLGSSGDKICFSLKKEDAQTCGVNHRGNQVALDPNMFYILTKTSSPRLQGLQSPSLDTSRLASYFIEHIRQRSKELSEWYRFFALVNLTLDNFEGSIDLSRVEAQESRLGQPLRTPGRSRGRLRFDEDPEEQEEEGTSLGQASSSGALSAWDLLPETPVMSDEGCSTEEERDTWTRPSGTTGTVPANLVRTIHALQQGLEENTNNLIMMHRELSGRWVLISEDLKTVRQPDCSSKSGGRSGC